MKICTICKEEKNLDGFNKNKGKKDGLNNICKVCSQERSKKYYNENKDHHVNVIRTRNLKIINENRQKLFDFYRLNPCVDCGETDPIVLECDHRDDVEKIDNVSTLIAKGNSWVKIEKEIEKCDVRCANCHRRRTAIQQGWYKGII